MNPDKFLAELKTHDNEKYKIVSMLRQLILKNKTATEEVKYGGLFYSDGKPYAGLFVSKNHVSMEFSDGATFKDPNKHLLGTGKYRRHLKFSSVTDVDLEDVNKFLKQAI